MQPLSQLQLDTKMLVEHPRKLVKTSLDCIRGLQWFFSPYEHFYPQRYQRFCVDQSFGISLFCLSFASKSWENVQKTWRKEILAHAWSAQLPNAGRNIQHIMSVRRQGRVYEKNWKELCRHFWVALESF